MRRCPTSLQYSGGAEDQSAGANGGHIFSVARLRSHELKRLWVAHSRSDSESSPRHANQIERRAIGQSMRRQQAQSTVARHRIERLRDNVDCGVWNTRQHLQRPGKVELRQIWEYKKSDFKCRHGGPHLKKKPDA